jgi:hypothetical protein
MKVKEYRFHIPIYHIFWELQFAELPECIVVSKLPGLDPDTLCRHPSYGRAIQSSTETPELGRGWKGSSSDHQGRVVDNRRDQPTTHLKLPTTQLVSSGLSFFPVLGLYFNGLISITVLLLFHIFAGFPPISAFWVPTTANQEPGCRAAPPCLDVDRRRLLILGLGGLLELMDRPMYYHDLRLNVVPVYTLYCTILSWLGRGLIKYIDS